MSQRPARLTPQETVSKQERTGERGMAIEWPSVIRPLFTDADGLGWYQQMADQTLADIARFMEENALAHTQSYLLEESGEGYAIASRRLRQPYRRIGRLRSPGDGLERLTYQQFMYAQFY